MSTQMIEDHTGRLPRRFAPRNDMLFFPFSHLAEIDNRATEMFDLLMKQLTEREGITEQLKAQDQLGWVGAMNNIRNAAEAIVNGSVIFAWRKD